MICSTLGPHFFPNCLTREVDKPLAVAPRTTNDESSRWHFRAAFTCLAINNLAAAFDATTLSQALPVSRIRHPDIKETPKLLNITFRSLLASFKAAQSKRFGQQCPSSSLLPYSC